MTEHELLSTESGNSVVVALDHGLSLGAPDGFENPGETLDEVLSADPDGVLVSPHFARRYQDRLSEADVDLVVTADVVTSSSHPGLDDSEDIWTPAFDTDLLLDLDPAGVKVVLVFSRDDLEMYMENIRYVAELAEELRGTGVPLVVEPVMWGARVPEKFETDTELVANGQRMAWEYGADIIKSPYTGDQDAFSNLVDNAPVPVMILGGPASGTTRAMLEDVEESMQAGARGIMIGRSIWKSEDPATTVSALNEIVHDGAAVDDVWG